jgi:hypothetical protein
MVWSGLDLVLVSWNNEGKGHTPLLFPRWTRARCAFLVQTRPDTQTDLLFPYVYLQFTSLVDFASLDYRNSTEQSLYIIGALSDGVGTYLSCCFPFVFHSFLVLYWFMLLEKRGDGRYPLCFGERRAG